MTKLIGLTFHYEDGTTTKARADGITIVVGAVPGASKYQYINADECPVHGKWRAVPAGEKNGKTWSAFWSCDTPKDAPRCTNRPSKEWVETHPPERILPQENGDFDDLPF